MVIIFTVPNCPKCKMLKDKMTKKNIEFKEESDLAEVIDRGFRNAPVLKVEDEYLDFARANDFITRYEVQ